MIARRMMPPTTPPAIPAALILGVMTGPLVGFVITNEINGKKHSIFKFLPLYSCRKKENLFSFSRA